MKNRKTVVVAFLLVAVMLMGVGYAAVTNVLDIQGSASVSANVAEEEFNEDIYFKGVKDAQGNVVTNIDSTANAGYTANINTNNNDKAQFTALALANQNDKVTITYVIQNDSAFDATVGMKTNTNTNGSINGGAETGDFDFTYYFADDTSLRSTTIPAGGQVEVTVVVTLKNQLSAASSASFVLELQASAGA